MSAARPGISAGAINAAYLASRADRMVEATSGLAALWSDVQIDWVMRTDALSLFSIVPALAVRNSIGPRVVQLAHVVLNRPEMLRCGIPPPQ